MSKNENAVWYFVCSTFNGEQMMVAHVDHDYTNRDDAEIQAKTYFKYGVTVENNHVEFDQVICISEYHEVCFHTTKTND